ncbi:hypothetical protein TL16_g10284 [Triparma laevis f. inornata]|uniref:Uncharacterized protein n=2 Tax=Triparma laevis TaxID=1534972 RepID=A0A9W6ZDA8_9STRA|nr:hypothetical protein TrLO_g12600 [Triparma laevis f. longispina]GMH85609.1 hypothetical protein TL16_g10284 [Triparma laevis f. inornata]
MSGRAGRGGGARSNTASNQNTTLKEDIATILECYQAMGGNQVTLREGAGNDYTKWTGLELKSMRVQKVKWCNINLEGALPPNFGNLSELQVLHIYSNSLRSQIPWSLCRLANLTSLSISNNKFYGPLPKAIGNLKNLTQLFAFNNGITGTLPESIYQCIELRMIDLSNNSIEGRLSSDIVNLQHLSELHLNSNKFSGDVPAELGLVEKLRRVRLHNNKFNDCSSISSVLAERDGVIEVIMDDNLNVHVEKGARASNLKGLENTDELLNEFDAIFDHDLGNMSSHYEYIRALQDKQSELLSVLTNKIINKKKVDKLVADAKEIAGMMVWKLRRKFHDIVKGYRCRNEGKWNLLRELRNKAEEEVVKQISYGDEKYSRGELLFCKAGWTKLKLLERVRREVVDVINDLVEGSGSSFVDLLKAFGIEEDDMEYEGFGLLSPLADEKFVLRGGRGAAGGMARDIRCLVGIERMERREEGSNIDINHVRLGFEDPSILAVVVTYFMNNFHVVRCMNVFRDGMIYEDMPGVYLWIDLENDGYIVKVVLSLWGVMKIEEEVRKFREVEEAEGAIEVCMERFGRRLRKKGAREGGGAVVVGGEEKQEDEVVVRVRARVMEKTASKVVKRGNGRGGKATTKEGFWGGTATAET